MSPDTAEGLSPTLIAAIEQEVYALLKERKPEDCHCCETSPDECSVCAELREAQTQFAERIFSLAVQADRERKLNVGPIHTCAKCGPECDC